MKKLLLGILLTSAFNVNADVDVYLGFGNPYYIRPPVFIEPQFQYIPPPRYNYYTPYYVERYDPYRDIRPHRRRREWEHHHHYYKHHHHD